MLVYQLAACIGKLFDVKGDAQSGIALVFSNEVCRLIMVGLRNIVHKFWRMSLEMKI